MEGADVRSRSRSVASGIKARGAVALVLVLASGALACTSDNAATTAHTVETSAGEDAVATGKWGGDDIVLTVSPTGATVEYECAAGRIDEPLTIDEAGRFEADGVYASVDGGPVEAGAQQPKAVRARYVGSTEGSAMTLAVFLPKTKTRVGVFQLERGRQPNLDRCV